MADVHLSKPYPRGLTGTAGAGNYDIDVSAYMRGSRQPIIATPSLVTIIVDADAVVQFMSSKGDLVVSGGNGGDINVGGTCPLKSGVPYIFKGGFDIVRFVSSAVVYRIIAEY